MYEINCGDSLLRIIQGDIIEQDTDAVVNAANKRLAPGGGVAGAIHRVAGVKLWEECKKFGGCETGDAVITKGYNLPAKWVVHTVGPVYRGREEDLELLALSYENSLKIAEKESIKTISFPAISTGAFGYPMREAAKIAVKTVCKTLTSLSKVKMVQFVLYDFNTYKIFEEVLKEVENDD
ncbi:O-acetyl-ADP-ribose deacetylase [candidate division WOR-3 bacterium]|nr:O-acetyl-ADP-ribose deacetylase [candidate division WOR-3 bacterium]